MPPVSIEYLVQKFSVDNTKPYTFYTKPYTSFEIEKTENMRRGTTNDQYIHTMTSDSQLCLISSQTYQISRKSEKKETQKSFVFILVANLQKFRSDFLN